jgi:hypothetical protein
MLHVAPPSSLPDTTHSLPGTPDRSRRDSSASVGARRPATSPRRVLSGGARIMRASLCGGYRPVDAMEYSCADGKESQVGGAWNSEGFQLAGLFAGSGDSVSLASREDGDNKKIDEV